MTIFDLVFLVAAGASAITIGAAVIFAIRGERYRMFRTIRNWAVIAAAYLVVAVGVSFATPQHVRAQGQPWCFDDWCLTVESVSRTAGSGQVSYTIGLNIFSRARRVSQRANGAWIYLIDENGRRYAAKADPSAVPLNVLLGPGESVHTSRVFDVPSDVHRLGLITGHGGSYCGPMSLLIIGQSGCLFNKPAMIQIQ